MYNKIKKARRWGNKQGARREGVGPGEVSGTKKSLRVIFKSHRHCFPAEWRVLVQKCRVRKVPRVKYLLIATCLLRALFEQHSDDGNKRWVWPTLSSPPERVRGTVERELSGNSFEPWGWWSESCSVMSDSLWPHGLNRPWNSPDQNIGVGSRSLFQGIFPAQGSNPGLQHCRQILHQLSHKRSPRILEWVAYPFSNRSPWFKNWTRVSCIASGFFPIELSEGVEILKDCLLYTINLEN